MSQAGSSIQFQGAGEWIADLSKDEQEIEFQNDPTLKQRWHTQFGDKQTELVLV